MELRKWKLQWQKRGYISDTGKKKYLVHAVALWPTKTWHVEGNHTAGEPRLHSCREQCEDLKERLKSMSGPAEGIQRPRYVEENMLHSPKPQTFWHFLWCRKWNHHQNSNLKSWSYKLTERGTFLTSNPDYSWIMSSVALEEICPICEINPDGHSDVTGVISAWKHGGMIWTESQSYELEARGLKGFCTSTRRGGVGKKVLLCIKESITPSCLHMFWKFDKNACMLTHNLPHSLHIWCSMTPNVCKQG